MSMNKTMALAALSSLILVGCSDDPKHDTMYSPGVSAQIGAQAKANQDFNRSTRSKFYTKIAEMVKDVQLEKNEDQSATVRLIATKSILGSTDCFFDIQAGSADWTTARNGSTKLNDGHKKCSDITAKVEKTGDTDVVTFRNIYTTAIEFKSFFRTVNLQITNASAADQPDSQALAKALNDKKLQAQVGSNIWPSQMKNVIRDKMIIVGEMGISGKAQPTDESENLVIKADSNNIHLGEYYINIAGKEFIKKEVEVEAIKIDMPNANYIRNSDQLVGAQIEVVSDKDGVSVQALLK